MKKVRINMLSLLTLVLLIVTLWGSPPASKLKVEPRASKWGEQLLKEAHEAYRKGNYVRAYELSKKVYDKEGDVWAAWFKENFKIPSDIQIDLYDDESILQAIREYHKKHGKFINLFKYRVIENSTALLAHSLFKLGRYEELERYAIEILSRDPEAQRIRSILDASRRLRREKAGKNPLHHSLLMQLPDRRKVVIDVERGRGERAGAIYTPAEDIARLLGLRFEQQGHKATFLGKGIKATMQIESDFVQINGRSFKLPKPPYMKGKELLVPVELLQELAKAILK
ncbi:MAG: hypothetical protein DFNUSKGM_000033 [Candidatus Fervidibacter sacchari]